MTEEMSMSAEEFDAMVRRLCVWRADAGGAPLVKDITRQVTQASAAEVETGEIVQLGRLWNVAGAVDNRRPALHYMTMLGDAVASGDVEPHVYMDFVGADFHGKTVSHIDAFCHMAYQGEIFGGQVASEAVSSHGFGQHDVLELGSIATRGVLIDMARSHGEDWCDTGAVWSVSDVESALRSQNTELTEGCAVLFRSGQERRREVMGPWDADESAAGVDPSVVEWLAGNGVRVIGADGETDARPSHVQGVTLPVHVLSLYALGIPLLDNLRLEELSQVASRLGRWSFAFRVSPLRVAGGTGSPVNPMAIF